MIDWLIFWCLTSLSVIFQLYHGEVNDLQKRFPSVYTAANSFHHHDIAEILLKLALNTNHSINQQIAFTLPQSWDKIVSACVKEGQRWNYRQICRRQKSHLKCAERCSQMEFRDNNIFVWRMVVLQYKTPYGSNRFLLSIFIEFYLFCFNCRKFWDLYRILVFPVAFSAMTSNHVRKVWKYQKKRQTMIHKMIWLVLMYSLIHKMIWLVLMYSFLFVYFVKNRSRIPKKWAIDINVKRNTNSAMLIRTLSDR